MPRSTIADEIIQRIRSLSNHKQIFLGTDLKIHKDVYPPDVESVLLARHILQGPYALKPHETFFDYGCGSGCIAKTASRISQKGIASDLSKAAVACAVENLRGTAIEVRHGSGFSVLQNEKFDLIVCSPPYEDAPVNDETELAVYDPNFKLRNDLFDNAHKHLTNNGRILFTYSERCQKQNPIDQDNRYDCSLIDTCNHEGQIYQLWLIVPKAEHIENPS